MDTQRIPRSLRVAPLTLAMAFAFTQPGAVDAANEQTHNGGIQLRTQLRSLMPAAPKQPQSPAQTRAVTSCADDSGSGTLRAIVAASGEGDTVDLSSLQCSSITLSQGAIPVLLDDLTVTGPGADKLVIDGADADRIFVHPGYGRLRVQGLTISGGASRVTDNRITGGACIASAGYVVLDHSTVTRCYGSGEGVYGGGVFAYGLYMYTSILSSSIAHGVQANSGTAAFGGGAYASYAFVLYSTISGNRAEHDLSGGLPSYDTGGGIFTNNGGQVFASTIEGNYSYGLGGGFSSFGGFVNVTNSTISGNQARTGTGGGLDLRVFFGGIVSNSTIAANVAAKGGGLYLRGLANDVLVQSTLISGNIGANGADVGAATAATIAGTNNLVVGSGANVTLPLNTLRADPMLLALADNGGPTRTHALTPGSPAIDAGNNLAGLANDQRGPGFARVLGPAPDIGALEGAVQRPFVRAPAASPGILALIALLIGGLGSLALRRRQVFTRFSPGRAHSSHT